MAASAKIGGGGNNMPSPVTNGTGRDSIGPDGLRKESGKSEALTDKPTSNSNNKGALSDKAVSFGTNNSVMTTPGKDDSALTTKPQPKDKGMLGGLMSGMVLGGISSLAHLGLDKLISDMFGPKKTQQPQQHAPAPKADGATGLIQSMQQMLMKMMQMITGGGDKPKQSCENSNSPKTDKALSDSSNPLKQFLQELLQRVGLGGPSKGQQSHDNSAMSDKPSGLSAKGSNNMDKGIMVQMLQIMQTMLGGLLGGGLKGANNGKTDG